MAGERSPIATGDADGVQPHRDGGAYRVLLSSRRCLLARVKCARADVARSSSRRAHKAEIGETATSDKAYEAVLQAIVEAASIPESRKEGLRAMKKEELLRAIVDNVGKRNTAGQDLQNVISVAMLSEGWDAKNVTHIMGCALSPANSYASR